jgi:hypothetical protein
MRYLIRLNPRAFNPLTQKVIASRLWEIEQCEKTGGNGLVDSKQVIWHAANVRIDKQKLEDLVPLAAYRDFAQPAKIGEKKWELEVWGVCTRGQDDAVEIRTGEKDVSGN